MVHRDGVGWKEGKITKSDAALLLFLASTVFQKPHLVGLGKWFASDLFRIKGLFPGRIPPVFN